MINVQITDDHKILSEGLKKIINESGIAEVTATYFSLSECREGLASGLPDVLLLDINLPDGNGLDFCAEINEVYPDLKILILTSFNEFSIAKRALHNGASGYILKNAMCEEVIAGIECVTEGKIFLCEEIDLLMKERKKEDIIWLTAREKEVLKLIAEGYSNPEIAERIFLSYETVKGYRKDLLLKFGTKNSVMMIRKAIEQKLV